MAKILVTLQRTQTATIEIDGIADDLVDSAVKSAMRSHPEAFVSGHPDLVWTEPYYQVKEATEC